MTLKNLYEASPFGMVSSFLWNNTSCSIYFISCLCNINEFYNFRNIYCNIFISSFLVLFHSFQLKISDIYDRRLVIVTSTFGAAFFALFAILVSRQMYLPGGLATSKLVLYF